MKGLVKSVKDEAVGQETRRGSPSSRAAVRNGWSVVGLGSELGLVGADDEAMAGTGKL